MTARARDQPGDEHGRERGRPRRSPDLRLFGFAAGTWAASLAGLLIRAEVAVAVAVAAIVLAAVVGALLRPGRAAGNDARAGVGWLVAGALLGVACGAMSTAARTSARDAEPLASLVRAHATVRAELTVTDDPRPLRSARAGPVTYLIPARLHRLDPVNQTVEGGGAGAVRPVRLDVRVIVFANDGAWRGVLPSQRVATRARLGPANGADLTAAVLSTAGAPQLLGTPTWSQVAAGRLRAGLQAACLPLPPEPGGLLPGLVIGDTSRLDPALVEDFRETGLTHLVAVSGANVAIVLAVVLVAARWCRAGPGVAAGLCFVALIGFVILARPSPSVVRAAAMGGVGLLALASGRARSAAPALAVAVVVGLLVDPDLAVDAGFVLSVLATGALVLLAPRWRDALRARGVPSGVAEAFAVAAAAQVACAPVVAGLSGSVSLFSVVANLLAVPAVAPATLLGVGAAVLSPLWLGGAEVLAWLACWPARWLVLLAHTGARLPIGSLPWPSGVTGAALLAATTTALVLAWRQLVLRRLVVVVALGVAVGAVPVRLLAPGWAPAGAIVIACDVGQGDALVLPVAPGEAVVVDAGPDPLAVDGCLRRLGVDTVSLLVITHFHADHIGGATGVVRDRSLGGVVLPAFDEPPHGERTLRADIAASGAAQGALAGGSARVVEAEPGWTYTRGWLRLRVLGPVRPLSGTRSDPNNNSLVLRVVSRGVTVLLLGDAETEEQHDLLGLGAATLRADVVKVAHHGSAYQDPDLIAAIDARVALVSAGVGNRYGHPNPALLARLGRDGVRVLRTDTDGDLAVVSTHDGLGVVTTRASQRRRRRRDRDRRTPQARDPAGVLFVSGPAAADLCRRGERASMGAWSARLRFALSSVTRSCSWRVVSPPP